MNRNLNTSRLTFTALIAAVYVTLTLAFLPISFGSIQFRIAEILNLMAFIDPIYGVGVILGCLISNIFSWLGPIDIVIGTLGTVIAVWAITRTKNLLLASFLPVFANILVAFELTWIEHTPLWYNIATVWAGEIGVVVCLGYPLFYLLTRNEKAMALLRRYTPEKP